MTLFYSKTVNGFFDDAIHQTLPDDVVKMSPSEHQTLLGANAQGAGIEANDQGTPVAIFPDAAQQLITAKTQACARLTALAQRKLHTITDTSDEHEILSVLRKYRIAQAIGAGTATPADITALEAEIQARKLQETRADFCQQLLARGAFLTQVMGIVEGITYRVRTLINQAQTCEEINTHIAEFVQELERANMAQSDRIT